MRVVLIEPDIPQNTGAIMRLCACLGVGLDLVEPCGFILDDRRLRRAGMDYLPLLDLKRHPSWAAFHAENGGRRLILMTTHGTTPYTGFAFAHGDRLLFGSETAGAPEAAHAVATARLVIPLRPPARSLNVALAAAMVVAEALRQLGHFSQSSLTAGRERENALAP